MFKTFKKKKMKKKRGFVKRVQPVTGSHSLRGGAHLGPAGQQGSPRAGWGLQYLREPTGVGGALWLH